MDTLPFLQELFAVLGHNRHQPPHVGLLDTNDRDKFLLVSSAGQIDLRLPRAGNVNMRWVMFRRVNHEPEAVGAE